MNDGATWFLIADGSRARVFERQRPGAEIHELETLSVRAPTMRAPRDRPPRVHDRMGPGRHAVTGRTSPRIMAENLFLQSVAKQLNERATHGAFTHLVVCAPPHAMGVLRDAMSDAARRLLKCELVKDYAHEQAGEIVAHLESALRK